MKKLLLFLTLIFTTYSFAQIINVPSDQPTIQEGINAANDGDTVLVSEGTYYENINFKGKAITVLSYFALDKDTSHISKTIIDGSQPHNPDSASVVSLVSGEDSTSQLIGFTITNGRGTVGTLEGSTYQYRIGGGIHISEAGGTIESNIIINNELNAEYVCLGAGIAGLPLKENSLIIKNNIIISNQIFSLVYATGGGAYIEAVAEKNLGNIIFSNNDMKNNSISGTYAAGGGGVAFAGDQKENNVKFYNNRIIGNTTISSLGKSDGGGVGIFSNNCEIRNNIISDNESNTGGGVYIFGIEETTDSENSNKSLFHYLNKTNKHYTSAKKNNSNIQRQVLVNNTIANNKAKYGSEISLTNCFPLILNSIIWNENENIDNLVYGIPRIQYSCINGGFNDIGNINLNPLFIDSLYYLSNNSPVIDKGINGTEFNDIEDTENLGNAIWPALGTIRNDMGAYGGNPLVALPTDLKYYNNNFGNFLKEVSSAEIYDRNTIIDSFMNSTSNFPYVEDDYFCTFIYRDNVQKINLASDLNGWSSTAYSMKNIEGTNFWYYSISLDSVARIEYKFVINGSDWILDPLNPNKAEGGFGFNSEIAMPAYNPPAEITEIESEYRGTIHLDSYNSDIMNNTRPIKIYTPINYEGNQNKAYPLVFFHDGLDYLNFGKADVILDYLIHNKTINPVIAVFVPPISNDERDDEYVLDLSDNFTEAIVTELMPQIETGYRIITDPKYRAMLGPSFGGNISTKICLEHPEVFGFCAPYSPAYWPNNYQVLNAIMDSSKKEINFYLDWGRFEQDITNKARKLKDTLIEKGYNVKWNEWHEGHSWWSWRAHIDEALKEFDLITGVKQKEESLPTNFILSQNYPNPFNPSTIIKYSIPSSVISNEQSDVRNLNGSKISPSGRNDNMNVSVKVYDILGREVAILVNEKQNPGNYEINWDANNHSSGIYFYQLTAGDFIETKKMILMR